MTVRRDIENSERTNFKPIENNKAALLHSSQNNFKHAFTFFFLNNGTIIRAIKLK